MKPNPFKKRWWTRELTDLKKQKNRLNREAYRFRNIPNHPAKTELRNVTAEYVKCIKQAKTDHWNN
jgi:hypothetical protein